MYNYDLGSWALLRHLHAIARVYLFFFFWGGYFVFYRNHTHLTHKLNSPLRKPGLIIRHMDKAMFEPDITSLNLSYKHIFLLCTKHNNLFFSVCFFCLFPLNIIMWGFRQYYRIMRLGPDDWSKFWLWFWIWLLSVFKTLYSKKTMKV